MKILHRLKRAASAFRADVQEGRQVCLFVSPDEVKSMIDLIEARDSELTTMDLTTRDLYWRLQAIAPVLQDEAGYELRCFDIPPTKYTVFIQEVVEYTVPVTASSQSEAVAKAAHALRTSTLRASLPRKVRGRLFLGIAY